jgi:hypothetical protein
MELDELRRALTEAGVNWRIADRPVDASTRIGYLPSEGVEPLEEQEVIARDLLDQALHHPQFRRMTCATSTDAAT